MNLKKIIIKLIKFYQKYISYFFRFSKCKFYPTCSQYMIDAINKYGILKGIRLGMLRILRCNIFSKGGYDPVE